MIFIIGVSAGKAQAQFGVSDYIWALDDHISWSLSQLQGQDGYIELGNWATAFVEGGEIVEWDVNVIYGTY